ncbi:receptor-type tyrosine-protein phosphatase gamma-like isoform X3 [Lampetra planeri]
MLLQLLLLLQQLQLQLLLLQLLQLLLLQLLQLLLLQLLQLLLLQLQLLQLLLLQQLQLLQLLLLQQLQLLQLLLLQLQLLQLLPMLLLLLLPVASKVVLMRLWLPLLLVATVAPLSLAAHGSDNGSSSEHWTHRGDGGQATWPTTIPQCGGSSQSPVNIDSRLANADNSLQPIVLHGFESLSAAYRMRNNGHTVKVYLPESMSVTTGLPSEHTAAQLHLHWGARDEEPGGSEHTVDGQRYDAEMHVVLYNSESYASVAEALGKPQGLAVLGVLLQVGSQEHPAFQKIVDGLKNIKYSNQATDVGPFEVRSLLPPDLGRYFRYDGSLTTPPCTEGVSWIVFNQTVRVGVQQLEALQTGIMSTQQNDTQPELLDANYRLLQALNRRSVRASFTTSIAVRGKPGTDGAAPCQQPLERGGERGERRWGFDGARGVCVPFLSEGQAGNANSFPDVVACSRSCLPNGATLFPERDLACKLPADSGPCQEATYRIHFNASNGLCESFPYSGCGGNGNSFPSTQACRRMCGARAITRQSSNNAEKKSASRSTSCLRIVTIHHSAGRTSTSLIHRLQRARAW